MWTSLELGCCSNPRILECHSWDTGINSTTSHRVRLPADLSLGLCLCLVFDQKPQGMYFKGLIANLHRIHSTFHTVYECVCTHMIVLPSVIPGPTPSSLGRELRSYDILVQ